MFSLWMRFSLLLGLLFAFIYALITIIGTRMGIGNFYFYLGISLLMMLVQYMIGPKIVEWTMHIKYIKKQEYPSLFSMVEDLARKANLPVPRIGIAPTQLPNAFAFGRGFGDGRVCVTQGILQLLSEDELKAVLGHEMSHLKNRDVLTITLLSVIPMIMYRIAWHFMWYGGGRRDERNSSGAYIGIAAFIFYFITNLLVLYASRIREYFADKGAVELGCNPSLLASSLYKLSYGAARVNKEEIKQVEGIKAFFVSDPGQAYNEIRELAQLDLDKNGVIDQDELFRLRNKTVRLGVGEKLMEALSTHPNMLKRIKRLSTYH